MKLLIAIPMLTGADHCKLAIESVLLTGVEILLIDNGATNEVKSVIEHYAKRDNVTVISNSKNVYVNPAWNQALKHFLTTDCTHIAIMNSDLIMRADWYTVLSKFITSNPLDIPVCSMSGSLHGDGFDVESHHYVESSVAGTFIVLNKAQALMCFPIPGKIKVWFGDNWIYELLWAVGYKTAVINNLRAIHYAGGSRTILSDPTISEVIEQDKTQWPEVKKMLERKAEAIKITGW